MLYNKTYINTKVVTCDKTIHTREWAKTSRWAVYVIFCKTSLLRNARGTTLTYMNTKLVSTNMYLFIVANICIPEYLTTFCSTGLAILLKFYGGSIIIPPICRLRHDRSVGGHCERFATYIKKRCCKCLETNVWGKLGTLTCDALLAERQIGRTTSPWKICRISVKRGGCKKVSERIYGESDTDVWCHD